MAAFNEDGNVDPADRLAGAGNPGSDHHRLIASDRVEGTAVYNRDGDRLGTVRRFLVDKRSGQAEYAEMAFGGFLGLGEDVHPLPWERLEYDPAQGGYVVDLTEDQLRAAPRYGEEDRPVMDDIYYAEIRNYYGIFPPV